jgi:hypothetical protein
MNKLLKMKRKNKIETVKSDQCSDDETETEFNNTTAIGERLKLQNAALEKIKSAVLNLNSVSQAEDN